MAKQKNQIDDNMAPIEGAESFQSSDASTIDAPQSQPKAANSPEKREKKQEEEEPDSYILDVLKAFPAHESLFVDRQGGAFHSDTPEQIRGSAILYKNPFYKP